MFSMKVAILGCARDCARYLPQSVRNISAVVQMFADYRVIVYENDSLDNTRAILAQYKQGDPERRHIMGARFLNSNIPGRTRRLAYVRQQLLEKLRSMNFRPDVVVVMDLDDAGAGATHVLLDFVRASVAFSEWDAAFPRLTYDRAAWTPWPHTADRGVALQEASEFGPLTTRVCSTFNGIGVYKAHVYLGGAYIAPGQQIFGRNRRPGPCEHITFHASLGPHVRLNILNGFTWPS